MIVLVKILYRFNGYISAYLKDKLGDFESNLLQTMGDFSRCYIYTHTLRIYNSQDTSSSISLNFYRINISVSFSECKKSIPFVPPTVWHIGTYLYNSSVDRLLGQLLRFYVHNSSQNSSTKELYFVGLAKGQINSSTRQCSHSHQMKVQ